MMINAYLNILLEIFVWRPFLNVELVSMFTILGQVINICSRKLSNYFLAYIFTTAKRSNFWNFILCLHVILDNVYTLLLKIVTLPVFDYLSVILLKCMSKF